MVERMHFIVTAPDRGTHQVEVPLSYLEMCAAKYDAQTPEVQGAERHETFIALIQHVAETEREATEFHKAITSIMFYLLFGHESTNPQQIALRASAKGVELMLSEEGLVTTVFDDKDEYDARIDEIKGLNGGEFEPVATRPTLH